MNRVTKLISESFHLLDSAHWEQLTFSHFHAMSENNPIFFSKKNILFVFSDHLGDDSDFLLPADKRSTLNIDILASIIKNNANHNFWILCGILNLNNLLGTLPNVNVIHWIDEMFVIQNQHYSEVAPQKEKNLKSDKHWIMLSQNKRIHRYLAAMYLLGTNLDKTGLIRIDSSELQEHESWQSYKSYWKHNGRKDELDKLLSYSSVFEHGFNKIKNNQGYHKNRHRHKDDLETKYLSSTQNHINFDKFLKPLYKNSVVEIVNETIFMHDYGLITEKFLNSVYAFNLPIILNVPGAVAHLRDIGFDMFDRVIDHSYDTILDPIPRLIQALNNNKHLLEDADLARSAWQKCLPGMENNYQLAYNLETTLESTFKEHLLRINNEC